MASGQVDLRTMQSDAASIKSSGGIGVEPKTFDPNELIKDGVFQPQKTAASGGKKKAAIMVAVISAVLAGAAAVAYFVIFPSITSDKTPVPAQEEPRIVEPVAEEPQVEEPAHVSVFGGKVASERQIVLSGISVAEIRTGLSSGTAAGTGMEDISFSINGNPVTSGELLGVMMPVESLSQSLESDFTAFVYHDANGSWPGYVFTVKTPMTLADAKTAIETRTDLNNFYAEDPGKIGTFKDGAVGGVKARYATFVKKGASFNYGFVGDYLVISTSFNGFKEAVNLLAPGA